MKKKEDYRFKWDYDLNDPNKPQGCCYDCRMKYSEFPDMIISKSHWSIISPVKKAKDAGLLCPTCISNRLDWLGLWYDNYLNSEDGE